MDAFEDDAVYLDLLGAWQELIDPSGVSLNVAFVITPEPTFPTALVWGVALLVLIGQNGPADKSCGVGRTETSRPLGGVESAGCLPT